MKHYHIKQNSRAEFYLSEKHCCKSIPDLINYHKHNSGGLASRLKTSPCDRPVPPTAGLSHGKNCMMWAEDFIYITKRWFLTNLYTILLLITLSSEDIQRISHIFNDNESYCSHEFERGRSILENDLKYLHQLSVLKIF